jgi:NADPH2:quinone reductase
MRAAWYDRQGPAREVLTIGEMRDPEPALGEVRIRVVASGVNPGDVKKRQDAFGYGMPYPRVIPHSVGAGVVDRVGSGVAAEWLGQRVWCYGAQSYRPFGTAAEYTVVPVEQVAKLPDHVTFEQAACLGIPAITAYQAVNIAGDMRDRTVLVQGGAGAVSICAIQLARRAGAHVIATVRSPSDVSTALSAGAQHVEVAGEYLIERVRELVPRGVWHIVEVAFGANIAADVELLEIGGSIAAYASDVAALEVPFWALIFKNIRMFFLGSDDFPVQVKRLAANATNEALSAGWKGSEIAHQFALSEIATAHERVEHPIRPGRVVVSI